mgnify:CR=1 FL=1
MDKDMSYGKHMADGINEFRKQKSSQPPMKQGSADDFQSPEEALNILVPYLKKEWMIWECANKLNAMERKNG